jgi:proline iminopeptidase
VASTQTQGFARMADDALIGWTAEGDTTRRLPVVMLHGGPGLPDYLGEVATMIADLAPVYRYDQRGTGRSEWQGRHSLARHVDDLAELLDAWGATKAVLIGHSYGTDLASRFCLAHADRVTALLLMCGPWVGDWRTTYRAERALRMTAAQQEGLHARPVNWAMNSELGKERRADPLERHLDELYACLPARTELLGGADDPRPLSALESLSLRLEVPLTRIAGGGHEPWLEQPESVHRHLRRFAQRAVCPS